MEIKVNDIVLTTDFTRADVDYSIKRHTEIFSEEFGFTDAFNEMVKKIISDFPAEYNAEKDITKYPQLAADSYVTCQPGMFAIFFPQDGHAPCIATEPIRKAIFKVAAK